MKKYKELLKNKYLLLGVFSILILVLIQTSYAFFVADFRGQKDVIISTPGLKFTFKESGTALNLDQNSILSDIKGKVSNNYFDFEVKFYDDDASNGTVKYWVYLKIDSENSTLSPEIIKYYLTDQENNMITGPGAIEDLNRYGSIEDAKVLHENTITSSNSALIVHKYRLRAWIDETYEASIYEPEEGEPPTEDIIIPSETFKFKVGISTKEPVYNVEIVSVTQEDAVTLLNTDVTKGTMYAVTTTPSAPTVFEESNEFVLSNGTYYGWTKSSTGAVTMSNGKFTITTGTADAGMTTATGSKNINPGSTAKVNITSVAVTTAGTTATLVVKYTIATGNYWLGTGTGYNRRTCLASNNSGSVLSSNTSNCVSNTVEVKAKGTTWNMNTSRSFTTTFTVNNYQSYPNLYLKIYSGNTGNYFTGYSISLFKAASGSTKILSPLSPVTHDGMILWLDTIRNKEVIDEKILKQSIIQDLSGNNNHTSLKNGIAANWGEDYFNFPGGSNDYGIGTRIVPPEITVVAIYTQNTIASATRYIIGTVETGGFSLNILSSGDSRSELYSDKQGAYKYAEYIPIVANVRYMHSFTYDRSNIRNYNRATLFSTSAAPSSTGIRAPGNSTVYALGVNPNGSAPGDANRNNFKIHSIRLYNRALSQAELNDIYEFEKTRYNLD